MPRQKVAIGPMFDGHGYLLSGNAAEMLAVILLASVFTQGRG